MEQGLLNNPRLSGQIESNVDSKGRIAMPQQFRRKFGDEVIVIKWDKYLRVLHPENFDKLSAQVTSRQSFDSEDGIQSFFDPKPQLDLRHFYGNVYELSFDAQGRLTIPKGLRDSLDLYAEAMWVGTGNYVGLWALKHWIADCARWTEAGGYGKMFSRPPQSVNPSAEDEESPE